MVQAIRSQEPGLPIDLDVLDRSRTRNKDVSEAQDEGHEGDVQLNGVESGRDDLLNGGKGDSLREALTTSSPQVLNSRRRRPPLAGGRCKQTGEVVRLMAESEARERYGCFAASGRRSYGHLARGANSIMAQPQASLTTSNATTFSQTHPQTQTVLCSADHST